MEHLRASSSLGQVFLVLAQPSARVRPVQREASEFSSVEKILVATWDLFKYPGIRSVSDMHTLGFSLVTPWMAEKSVADGPAVMHYLDETVERISVAGEHSFFPQGLSRRKWCSADARWVLTVDQGEGSKTGEISSLIFFFMCSGYYSYDQPYDAQIPGVGRIIRVVMSCIRSSGQKALIIAASAWW